MNVEMRVPPWLAEENPYLGIAQMVIRNTPEEFHERILWITSGSAPRLVAGDENLNQARLMHAAHLLTGPILLGVVSRLRVEDGTVSGPVCINYGDVPQLMSRRAFDPRQRMEIIRGMSRDGQLPAFLAAPLLRLCEVSGAPSSRVKQLPVAVLDTVICHSAVDRDTQEDLVNMVVLLLCPAGSQVDAP